MSSYAMLKRICFFSLFVLSFNFTANQVGSEELSAIEKAERASQQLLRAKWDAFFAEMAANDEKSARPLNRVRDNRFLPAPERRVLAVDSVANFSDPPEVRSLDGELNTTLDVGYAQNRIGQDRVYLRSYNGRLVGPTLRVQPGDTLRISLVNNLPEEEPRTGGHNTLHGFNTTNLHMHGLHVSPSGIADNVFLRVEPGQTQDYEIEIPDDHVAGTFWYHAHKHGAVAAQVSSGMAGALIVGGGIDDVAEIANARERVMVLQQIPYYNQNLPEGVIELRYAGNLFGPGDWNALERFTTINGVKLPVIRMRPGEVERWRLISSGFRERITFVLDRESGEGPAKLPLHEIAVDGLPLGKSISREQIELWPGYRSDVLVKAPNVPGEYILIDESAEGGINGASENRKHIGRLIVAGDLNDMPLPDNDDLSPFRLPSITDDEVTGTQTITYGVNNRTPGQPSRFEIDGEPYSESRVRQLYRGDVEEWVAASENNVGFVPHPFHIHTNPFEIIAIENSDGENVLENGPVWRDTIILRPGLNVRFRTRYEDFTGDFVNHCHILDHEDQGMMELVRISDRDEDIVDQAVKKSDPPSVEYGIPDFKSLRGKPTVVLFIRGLSCVHCNKQVGSFVESLKGKEIRLLAISSEKPTDPRPFPEVDCTICFDLKDKALKKYRSNKRDSHGVVLFNAHGEETWRKFGDEPILDVASILSRLDETDETTIPIEIEVRNSESTSDDYITWTPTPCQIRIHPDNDLTEDREVVLTNDPQQPTPVGRRHPLDGDVAFATGVTPGQTATLDSLPLTLPHDGTWVSFVIAGKYPRASTNQRDAIIEVHDGDASGEVLTSHAVMVRIRKEFRRLTDYERSEFLSAMNDIHFKRDEFEAFVRLHKLAAGRNEPWSDQAHRGPGFLPWHRAFLLELERALQTTHPHVALPYWLQDQPPNLFSKDAMGTTLWPDNVRRREIYFDPMNPLYGWRLEFDELGGLVRSDIDHSLNSGAYRSGDFLQQIVSGQYPSFRRFLEENPHNDGHNNTGEWMQRCTHSPADPLFWVFHCHHDHLWAHWQWYNDRFETDGSDPDHYAPVGDYQPTEPNVAPFGHYLNDTMWPWDESTGEHENFPDDSFSLRPDEILPPFGLFPASAVDGLWPANAASPTPADMIDYLGLSSSRLAHGFAYDDTPYGHRVVDSPVPLVDSGRRLTEEFALDVFVDPKSLIDNRIRSMKMLNQMTEFKSTGKLRRVINETDAPPEIRGKALDLLLNSKPEAAARASTAILSDQAAPNSLKIQAAQSIVRLMHFGEISDKSRRLIHVAILRAATDSEGSSKIQAEAIRALSSMRNPAAAGLLVGHLSAPKESPLPQQEVVSLLALFNEQLPLVRNELESRNDEVVFSALLALAGDTDTRQRRAEISQDQSRTTSVRQAAIQSLMYDNPQAAQALLNILTDSSEPAMLRKSAAASIRVMVQTGREKFSQTQLSAANTSLEGVLSDRRTPQSVREVVNTALVVIAND